jgi:hypothetical protein
MLVVVLALIALVDVSYGAGVPDRDPFSVPPTQREVDNDEDSRNYVLCMGTSEHACTGARIR